MKTLVNSKLLSKMSKELLGFKTQVAPKRGKSVWPKPVFPSAESNSLTWAREKRGAPPEDLSPFVTSQVPTAGKKPANSNLTLGQHDPLDEGTPQPGFPSLVQKYPDRVLFLGASRSALYCRVLHPQTVWLGYGPPHPGSADLKRITAYLSARPGSAR